MNCVICNKEIIKGRQCIHTGGIYCDSTSCAGEYYLRHTQRWMKENEKG